MAIPTSASTGWRMRRAGIRVFVQTTDPRFGIDLQHSTASNAPTSKWIIQRMPASPSNSGVFLIELPFSTSLRYFRARSWRLGYADSPYTSVVSAQPYPLVATVSGPVSGAIVTGVSTVHNNQGSLLPYGVPTAKVTSRWGGIGAGQMWVAFTWSSFSITLADGTAVTVPGPRTALAAPTLSQQAGGVRAATTLYARIALVKDSHLYAISAESSLAVNQNNVLTIASPTTVAGYDSWMPLVGSASNSEYVQATGSSPNAGPLAFGTGYVEPTSHFTTADSQYDNTYWPSACVVFDGSPSVTGYFYESYDPLVTGTIRVFSGTGFGWVTAADAPSASSQVADHMLPLQIGAVTVGVGAGGGGGAGNSGGGRLT